MDNYLIDMRLSYTAIGILTVMLQYPGAAFDEVGILQKDRVSEEHEVIAGVSQLDACGYIERREGRWVVKSA